MEKDESEDSGSSGSEDEPNHNAGIPSDIIKMEVLRTLQFLLRGGQVNQNMIRQILFLFSALHNSTSQVFLQPFLFKSAKHNNRNTHEDMQEEQKKAYEDFHKLVDKWVSMVSGIRIAMNNVVQLRVVDKPPQIAWFPLTTVLLSNCLS